MKKYVCSECNSHWNKPYCDECDKSISKDSFIEEEIQEDFHAIKVFKIASHDNQT